jgi:hypothetical protein
MHEIHKLDTMKIDTDIIETIKDAIQSNIKQEASQLSSIV